MDVEKFRNYCLSLVGAKENAPWTEPQYRYLVTFTLAGKWFCLLDLENKFCDLKCAPDKVLELQDKYEGVQPAWHMNKTHWIKVVLDSDVPDDEIEALITDAYNLIFNSLTKAQRLSLTP